MNYKILVADDEQRMRILVSDFLTNNKFTVIEAADGAEALDLFVADPSIHLVILDVMMPKLNGFEVCARIREFSHVPIIMLTAKNTEQDELNGFIKGSDEYITKPFSPSILVARVKALIHRTYGSSDLLDFGCLHIDTKNHTLKCHDTSISLSQTEFKLLMYLINNKDQLLSRDQLLDNVWGYDYIGTDRTVDTHINRLRSKLLDSGKYIKTVRGYGYTFEVIL